MKLGKRIFLSLGTIAVLLAVVGLLLPSRVRLRRSVVIQAPAERVFSSVNTLSAWDEWSPWYAAEPDAKYVYSGPESGEGATAEWEGKIVGKGKQVITESIPNSKITTSLGFGPQGTATSDWTFEESEDGTTVTWGFETELGLNPISRYMGLMMDRWIGSDYEKGLNKLKSVCEAADDSADRAADESDTATGRDRAADQSEGVADSDDKTPENPDSADKEIANRANQSPPVD